MQVQMNPIPTRLIHVEILDFINGMIENYSAS